MTSILGHRNIGKWNAPDMIFTDGRTSDFQPVFNRYAMRTLKQKVSHKTKPLASCFISVLCLQGHRKLQVHAEVYKFNAACSTFFQFVDIQRDSTISRLLGLCLKKTSVFSAGNSLFFDPLSGYFLLHGLERIIRLLLSLAKRLAVCAG